jgi:hypothetical protein
MYFLPAFCRQVRCKQTHCNLCLSDCAADGAAEPRHCCFPFSIVSFRFSICSNSVFSAFSSEFSERLLILGDGNRFYPIFYSFRIDLRNFLHFFQTSGFHSAKSLFPVDHSVCFQVRSEELFEADRAAKIEDIWYGHQEIVQTAKR